METKYVRVPFEVELAKKITDKSIDGRIVTNLGKEVRIVCFDMLNEKYPIVGLRKDDNYTETALYVCDEEGNIKNDDYVNDPWSGLYYSICHEMDYSKGNDNVCHVATFKREILGTQLYERIDELVERWNRRI